MRGKDHGPQQLRGKCKYYMRNYAVPTRSDLECLVEHQLPQSIPKDGPHGLNIGCKTYHCFGCQGRAIDCMRSDAYDARIGRTIIS